MPKIITHNLPGWLPAADRTATVADLMPLTDMLCLQEAPWLDDADLPAGCYIVRGRDSALPIIVKDQFTVTGTMDRRAFDDTPVGEWGAGPDTLRAGWDFGVRLQRPSDGAQWWTVTAHLPPSAELDPPTNPTDLEGWNKRRELHGLEIAQLRAMTDALPGHVMVCGDFNADPDGDLVAPMREVFTYVSGQSYEDGRRLDHIWQRGGTLIEGPTLIPSPSDHHALYARFRL